MLLISTRQIASLPSHVNRTLDEQIAIQSVMGGRQLGSALPATHQSPVLGLLNTFADPSTESTLRISFYFVA